MSEKTLQAAAALAESQKRVDRLEGEESHRGEAKSNEERRQSVVGDEQEAMLMHVEGWEFVSEHALAKEYVMTAGDVISSV